MYSFAGPAEARVRYQKIRNILHPLLILFFMSAPWMTIDEQPMILFDVFNRHFSFFGYTFFSHDAPLLFFVIILIILIIFIVTAVFGRLWCGWSCPQTVFLHSLFNKVEKLFFGSYAKRQIFYKSSDSLYKKFKILLFYFVLLALCWILAHSFVAYFVGAEVITRFIAEGPNRHMNSFVVLMIMTGALFFNFAFFREKLCFFVCPYGKFQNSLIDRNTLTIFYDSMRGEPRGKNKGANKGDCVACDRCVRVCPVKIDIRQGFQSECISCAKCIDACNEVMQKVQKQTHLIRYETGNQKKITLIRFRLALYCLLFVVFLAGFSWSLSNRNKIDFNVTRTHLRPFSSRLVSTTKIIQNQVQLHLQNQTPVEVFVQLSVSEKNKKDGFKLVTPALGLILKPEQNITVPAFIEINENDYSSNKNPIELILESDKTKQTKSFQFIRIE